MGKAGELEHAWPSNGSMLWLRAQILESDGLSSSPGSTISYSVSQFPVCKIGISTISALEDCWGLLNQII